jgi:hypothetical protein
MVEEEPGICQQASPSSVGVMLREQTVQEILVAHE